MVLISRNTRKIKDKIEYSRNRKLDLIEAEFRLEKTQSYIK